ncbi:MAG: 4Fe-4S dicluster domain-containing protein [Chloroflexi bacterium]|nr:4Fe-4S dicluster domain-containing protein [Chloroflexota bacterium]
MLTSAEKAVFVLACLASLAFAARGARRINRIIRRGGGKFMPQDIFPRLGDTIYKTLTQSTVFRSRPLPSLFHALVAWAFMYYLVVNIGDGLQGLLPNFVFLGRGLVGDVYRLLADLLSVAALVGMSALLVRRFVRPPAEFNIRDKTLLHSNARRGIRRDSAIVGGFILLHVGARFAGESFHIAVGGPDGWRPFASAVSWLWAGWGADSLAVAQHLAWWLALGLILAFIPYFPRTKHIHIFFAPLNFLLKPERETPGVIDALDLNDSRYGAVRLEDLSWPQIMDAFACIMCNRCQDACPAYAAGTVLSPAALEINKRYQINHEGAAIAEGRTSRQTLLEFAIPTDAVWACTSCAACVDSCPVSNEPLRDILDIRRHLTLDEGCVPRKSAEAMRNVAILGNPWGGDPADRLAWAEGLNVRLMRDEKEVDVLYWIGCSAAYDARNRNIARAMARLLQKAGVDFAILGDEEACTGDPARRMGDEALFQKMARRNTETLSRYSFNRLLTHCPHCYNAFRNEYPALTEIGDWRFEVGSLKFVAVHHTQFINELIRAGRLKPTHEVKEVITFHDSCYLGRYNGEFDAPRAVLAALPGVELREMPRSRRDGFCCGGGGGGMWVDVPAERRVTDVRLEEALSLKPNIVASACPFCMTMFEGSALKGDLKVKDVAELLEEAL